MYACLSMNKDYDFPFCMRVCVCECVHITISVCLCQMHKVVVTKTVIRIQSLGSLSLVFSVLSFRTVVLLVVRAIFTSNQFLFLFCVRHCLSTLVFRVSVFFFRVYQFRAMKFFQWKIAV